MKIQKRFGAVLLCLVLLVCSVVILTSCGDCEHEWSEWTVTKDPTCFSEGEAYRVCALDKTHVETKKLDKTAHSFTSYTVVGEPTCTDTGLKTARCANVGCTAVDTKLIPAKGHTFTDYVPTPATCTTPSAEIAVCDEGCGATDRREVANAEPALEHDFGDDKICKRCHEFDEYIAQYDVSAEGSSVIATIYDTGEMFNKKNKKLEIIITGYGDMAEGTMPWKKAYGDLIVKATVMPGVSSLADGVFAEHDELVEAYLPDGIANIPENAFSECSELVSIEIPASVTEIRKLSFFDCSKLVTVTFAEGSELNSIWAAAFEDCKKLASITLPSSVLAINDNAFLDCKALEEVVIPEGIVSVSSSAFDGTAVATTEYEGARYLAIGENTYAILLNLVSGAESCKVNAGTTILASGAFEGSSLTALTADEGSVKYTAEGNCLIYGETLVIGIKTSVIPASITTIAPYAFAGCNGLTEITFPENVKFIAKGAFAGCKGLTSIVIPATVEEIGNAAFYGCDAVKSATITFTGATANGEYSTNFYWIFGNDASAVPVSLKTVTIVGADTIATHAFDGCNGITTVVIPATVTKIGTAAFTGCTALTKVEITDLTAWCSIDFADYLANPLNYSKALYLNGELITELVIPEGTTDVKFASFAGCTSITSITLPESLERISAAAFKDCSGITEIVIKDGVTVVEALAFANCKSLATVTLPATLTNIEANVFNGCQAIKTIYIPKTVESIDVSAFIGCIRLATVVVDAENENYVSADGIVYDKATKEIVFVPHAISGNVTILDGVTKILANHFASAHYVDTLIIPASVTEIEAGALSGLTTVKSITVPFIGGSLDDEVNNSIAYVFGKIPASLSSITVIGGTKVAKGAFEGCEGLTSVKLPEGIVAIEDDAFKGCISLTTVFLPKSAVTIGSEAFSDTKKLHTIYYLGTEAEFASLNVDNVYFKAAMVYTYDANPTEDGDGTNWYYGEDGEVVLW